jgi:hypothetical protein
MSDIRRDPMFVRFVRRLLESLKEKDVLMNGELSVNEVFKDEIAVYGLSRVYTVGVVVAISEAATYEALGRYLKPRQGSVDALKAKFSKNQPSSGMTKPSVPTKRPVKGVSSVLEFSRLDSDDLGIFDQEAEAFGAIPSWVMEGGPEYISAFNGLLNMPLNPNDQPSLVRYEISDGPARKFLVRIIGILRRLMVASGKNPDTDKSPLFGELIARVKAEGGANWFVSLLPVPGIPRQEFNARVEALSDPEWNPTKAREKVRARRTRGALTETSFYHEPASVVFVAVEANAQ